uniref:Uncharacterized protein n=1 Tax=Clastoptera arizonana TaxID=38151 RepID=A0A1B6DN13_9HEMI
MKVKMITRNPDDYMRETKRDLFKVPRNYDPALHPFEAPREYTRALNSVKLERVFAKPFIGNLDGHKDGISCLAKHPSQLSFVVSGDYDGEIRLWDLTNRSCRHNIQAHEGYVRGVVFTPDGSHILSVGDDKTIKKWSTDPEKNYTNVNIILSKTILSSITHSRKGNKFATCGEVCQLWEETRNEPIKSFTWGVDSLHYVSFNQVETNLLASCASDNSIIFYDTREAGPIRKLVMNMRTNQLAWNPMEAFVFTCANEDFK